MSHSFPILDCLRNPPSLSPRSPPPQTPHMLCQYSRTAQPHALIATFATLPLLFASSAWAAPLAKRSSSSSTTSSRIIVRPFMFSFFSAPSRNPSRRLSLWSLSLSSQSRCCSTGKRCFLSSGTSPFSLCSHRTNRLLLFKFGTLPRRRLPGQQRQLRLRPRQPLAQSDGQGALGALLVKYRHARCQHT